MIALLLAAMLLVAGPAAPRAGLTSGEYIIPSETALVGGARVRVDAVKRRIMPLGGCDDFYVVYGLEGSRLKVVEEVALHRICLEEDANADGLNSGVVELLHTSPHVALTDRGFDLTPGAGGQPVSFVNLQKDAQSE
ncbi:MAG: hypothetical protein EON87_22385 [Brevundimonas sp.]|nr:MAG: hypothetical protein EON87_22385 [Brevundimonas sp.]